MHNKKLKKAFPHLDRLANYLTGRGWEGTDELTTLLKEADEKIKKIEQKAFSDILAKLEGSYSKEAQQWSEDDMHDTLGEHIKTTKVEQRKALMEYKRIRRTIEKITIL